MPKLHKLTYRAWDGHDRVLDFLGAQQPCKGVQTTILTGHNGSHKSTILRELVSALAVPGTDSGLKVLPPAAGAEGPTFVICASGSVADRFPPKGQGGRPTPFDVPEYVYIGQRVGSNLLSKRLALETAIAFAIDPEVRGRFGWPFYRRAHQLAGIIPRLDLKFRSTTRKRDKEMSGRFLGTVQSIAQGKPAGRLDSMSKRRAAYLLDIFDYDEFTELDSLLNGKQRNSVGASLNEEEGFSSRMLSANALRLGLLSEQLVLADADVVSRRRNERFSVYELSSGEYHILTTILALGFSLRDGAVVLIDEPENSLHPQWQQDFMGTLFEMCNFMTDGHLVISTHSPLIVSSAADGSTVVDLSLARDAAPATSFPFGASADEILFEQFGIASSRNPSIVDVVQRAVQLTEQGREDGAEFEGIRNELRDLQKRLAPTDPLSDVVAALLESEE